MNTFRNLFYALLTMLLVSQARASECISAYTEGSEYRITVPANPPLSTNNGYQHDVLSQRSTWIDTNLYTTGSSFIFDISGMWTPFFGDLDAANSFLQAKESQLCTLVTENKDSTDYNCQNSDSHYCSKPQNYGTEVYGINGEFDYLRSSYTLKRKCEERGKRCIEYDDNQNCKEFNCLKYSSDNVCEPDPDRNGKCKTQILNPEQQKPCWMTGGEGLYIAFFGANGVTLPNIATHLKSAVIMCDEPYYSDKNDDGLITPDECYQVECSTKDNETTCTNGPNMAYYIAYKPNNYITAYPRCDDGFLHDNDGNVTTLSKVKNKIGINNCYQEIKDDNGNVIDKVNKIYFTFIADYLYKRLSGGNPQKVGKNERIKFLIYDTYYNDNSGQYIVDIRGGATAPGEPGLIEKILGDLEEVFVGKRNEYGDLEGGILKQFYTYIIRDTMFAWTVRMFIVLYMVFLGLQFAMGSLEYSTKELMGILLKLTFILGFTTITSWDTYDYFVVRFFVDGFSSIIVMIANISNRIFDPNAVDIASDSMSAKFAFIDNLIKYLFSETTTLRILGLCFGVWYGFIVIPLIYILILYYIWQLLNALFPYILMFIQAIIGLIIGPVFICFYLFKPTEHLFKNWLAFVGARFANMAFFFLFFFSFATIIKEQFEKILNFEVCKVPLLTAVFSTEDESKLLNNVLSFFSFGLKVWKANFYNGKPKFFDFCLSLLFLFILIYLFGQLMKKVPDVVDSMIDIGGESGGGLKGGKSELGGDLPTLGQALKKNIDGGDGGRISKPIKDFAKDIGRDIGKGAKQLLSIVPNKVGDAMTRSDLLSQATAKTGGGKGLKGMEAVNWATNEFRKELEQKGGISSSEINRRTEAFRTNAIDKMIKKPLKKEISKAIDLAKKTGMNMDKNTAQEFMSKHLDDFARKNLLTSGSDKELKEIQDIYSGIGDFKSSKYALSMSQDKGSIGNREMTKDQREEFNRRFMVLQMANELGIKNSELTNGSNADFIKVQKKLAEDLKKDEAKRAELYKKYYNKDINLYNKQLQENRNRYNKDVDEINKKMRNAISDSEKQQLELQLKQTREAYLAEERRLTKIKEEELRKARIDELKKKSRVASKNEKKLDRDKEIEDLERQEREKYLKLKLLENDYINSLQKQQLEFEENRQRLLEDAQYRQDYERLQQEIKDLNDRYLGDDGEKQKIQQELILQGIDDSFGVQGIQDDFFGSGKAIEMLSGDGNLELMPSATNEQPVEHDSNLVMHQQRLKIAQMNKKSIEFQLAIEEAKDPSQQDKALIQQLKDEKKKTEHDIRIIEDDINEDEQK